MAKENPVTVATKPVPPGQSDVEIQAELAKLEVEEEAKAKAGEVARREETEAEHRKDTEPRFKLEGNLQAVSAADIQAVIDARVEEAVAKVLLSANIQPVAAGSKEIKGDVRVRVLRTMTSHPRLGGRTYDLSTANSVIWMNKSHAQELGESLKALAWVGLV